MSDVKQTNEYFIMDLTLLSRDGSKTLRLDGVFQELTLFENIMDNTMRGSVSIVDTNGILETFPVMGDEFIYMDFSKTGESGDERVKYLGYIYKISDKQQYEEKASIQSYTLFFTSVEQMLSKKYKVDNNRRSKLSTMAKNIFEDKIEQNRNDLDPLTSMDKFREVRKKIDVEDTMDVFDITFPNLSPLMSMNMLARDAYSSNMNGGFNTTYQFYEDREGFHFKSIEGLIEQQRMNTEFPEFFFRVPNSIDDITYNSIRTISNFNIENTFDIMKSANSGHYGSTHVTFDPLSKTHYHNKFEYDDEFDKISHVDNFRTNSSKFFKSKMKDSKISAGLTTRGSFESSFISGKDEIFYGKEDEIIQLKRSRYNQLLGSQVVSFNVPGNPYRKLGEMIQVWIPSILKTGEKQRVDFDKYYSGRYLILGIKHMFTPSDYIMNLTAIKDGNRNEHE